MRSSPPSEHSSFLTIAILSSSALRLDFKCERSNLFATTPDTGKISGTPAPDCQNLNYANVGEQQSLVTKAIDIL
ncbi:MAG: hypothetical protein JGK24_21995 [Microcoleus sp. PH2017_29_MFU_D_A]|uniref:hypothetical protein n=1 Tax=unclassified Microcoleus TaxID=2642155 RepID=UPI001DC93E8E|nr:MULTISPECIES: hypothetical protein [unclassified Microcoleus]MCC3418080.1 hypothetical protein [Microcoleus sp. PH2017_07_MST_O_A]MCC3430163.1 hypothetical protein [Microcoleus sp. PH2017_04_SCI_O_A]MCC3442771.1 hypothetical protein [Microcoleus sp. PH2017_03_ELD_O_A]MCC3466937.1 hypothetical protein [Microcoleus sp. PH2017_06_SFM_O_A]MCC3504330.1 hypothetical protein [Microcoleus sp. PH2017_19_SFW_U_A]MCC3508982.1 hypothetical protein [Microcoleus sp. PH2017_17_BER_D_A]MCC3573896.1 hypot